MVKIKEKKTMSYKRRFLLHIIQIKRYIAIQKMLSKYIQHGNTNIYIHSRNVAYLSYIIARFCERRFKIKINYDVLVVGAMFHDFFLYDWHKTEGREKLHGFRHPKIASVNAQKYYGINEAEQLIIETHMWPLTITKFPKTTEAKIVCIADKICSTRETFYRF